VSHEYGRIDLGDAKSATQALAVNGGKVMVGTGHFARAGTRLVNNGSLAGARVVSYRGQGGTVRLTSPNFGGFTLSGSYTRQSDTDEIDGAVAPDVGSEDLFAVAGQYTSGYGNYQTVLYAGCEWSNNNMRNRTSVIAAGVSAGTGSNTVGTPATDQELCSFGSKVSAGAYGFAAGYGFANHDVPSTQFANDRQWVDVGAFYNFGAWQVSGGALYLLDEEGFDRHGEVYVYSGSVNFDVAPGLAIQGGVSHHVIEDTTLTPDNFSGSQSGLVDNEATTFTLSTQVNF